MNSSLWFGRFFGRLFIRLGGQFFQDRIRFHLLLHEIAQLEQRRLQNKKALLKLGRKDLLQRQVLRLVHPRAGHGNYEGKLRTTRGKQFSSRTSE